MSLSSVWTTVWSSHLWTEVVASGRNAQSATRGWRALTAPLGCDRGVAILNVDDCLVEPHVDRGLLHVDDCLVEPHVDRGRGFRSERAERDLTASTTCSCGETHPLARGARMRLLGRYPQCGRLFGRATCGPRSWPQVRTRRARIVVGCRAGCPPTHTTPPPPCVLTPVR